MDRRCSSFRSQRVKIFLVDLESVSTRYTSEWKTHLPEILKKIKGCEVHIIAGSDDIPEATTPGAFLNFGGTNIYKAGQVEEMGRLFCSGQVRAGDHFFFADAWHPGIINLKYMSELLNISVVTHGMWHAGSYDPQDFLGRGISNKIWVSHAEKSFFHAFDHNYFATQFHINMFCENLLDTTEEKIKLHYGNKIVRSGWPMNYLSKIFEPYDKSNKRDLILFPHRIAPEKQIDIFRDLQKQLPQYELVICQEQTLTKEEYHKLLCESKMVFSANLQETLGISCYEATLADSIPVVPDRLSYSEMYHEEFKYPSTWTRNFECYLSHREQLCEFIKNRMENYESYFKWHVRYPSIPKDKMGDDIVYAPPVSSSINLLAQQRRKLEKDFFTATNLLFSK